MIAYNRRFYLSMLIPEEVYSWLVNTQIIANQGEIDDKGLVSLPLSTANNFDNGFLVGEIIRKLSVDAGKKVPNALATVKADSSKNARLTNWNFIWLAIDSVGLKLDTRIKELILQGEQALIVEVLRQLHQRDPRANEGQKITIKTKVTGRSKVGHTQAVDVKKINLSKDPEDSESSLQFLILLLKASLGMNLEEILGLFTNQNKYLAHIIVKGVNDNFDSVILFYSLLNKHAQKLKTFYEQDSKDAEACLFALKPGFISKSQKVAELTIELFGKLGNIYQWFINQESKCAATLLLGVKRHADLRELYWTLLLELIQGQQIDFFSKHYPKSFQSPTEMVEITTYILKYISLSFLGDKLSAIGVIASWLQTATALPEDNLDGQIICFKLLGELMLFLPDVIEQNDESLAVLSRQWEKRSLPHFVTLFNELIIILEKLGDSKSAMARRIYLVVASIAKMVGAGDKKDYLVENFLPLISKFSTIPSQILIQHLKRHPLSCSEFLLICQSIEINENTETHVAVGVFLKGIFIQNPLLNFYLLTLLKEISQKVMSDPDDGLPFVTSLLEDSLQLYANLEIKYKPKPKQQASMYFGRKGSPQKVSKQQEDELYIKEKWKDLMLGLVTRLTDLAFSEEAEELKETIKEKLLNSNAYIRLNNHKIGSKALEELLNRRFGITKDEQVEHSQQFSKKVSAGLEESMLRRSKAQSNASGLKLKGPENLTKEFQLIAERRKQEEQQRKALDMKRQLLEEKKKISVKKELQITNLLRGQIGQAQLRQEGFLERLMHESKDLQMIPMEELESRDVEAAETILKKYHKVLRHLFLTYTATMYSSHTNQKFEDNQQRKEILSAVQLGKMLKDYKLAFLTSQPELNNMVRDINVKLLGRREVSELDYTGFQQFILQYCVLIFTRNHTITTHSAEGDITNNKNLKNQPIYVILKEFFIYLKNVFLTKGEKVAMFEDVSDIPLTKEQAYEVDIFNKKLQQNPNYILPKGYKKLIQKTVEFQHKFSPAIIQFPQAYEAAIEALDYILSRNPLNIHILEDLSIKSTIYKVKPIGLSVPQVEYPKQRAMSTLIQRKHPLIDIAKRRSGSKGLINALKQLPASTKNIGEEAAIVLDGIIDKVETSREKEVARQKKMMSIAKLQQIQKAKIQVHQRKIKEKRETEEQLAKKEKEEERKRREQTEKFLQEQRLKLADKKKRDEEEKQRKLKEEEELLQQKKENKEKFKAFHQGQLEKIKKIEQEATEKIKKSKDQEEQERERQEELRKKLREKIEVDDKRIVEGKKEVESKITKLYQSENIKRVFTKYAPNLKATFEFLLQHTYLSLTEKKHNGEVIYDTWRYFLHAFHLSPLILQAKDVVYIFKTLTRDKLVSKEYFIGLSFDQFQQALFRIAIKHKTIFNHISEKIKDKIEEAPVKPAGDDKDKKGGKKEGSKKEDKPKPPKAKQPQKEDNEFDQMGEINIKELIKENSAAKDAVDEYGDLTKVTDKTLLGLIYYLKVPNDKLGQEKRFRDVVSDKPTASVQNVDKLKEKLNEEYTLETPAKKGSLIKSISGTASHKSIK